MLKRGFLNKKFRVVKKKKEDQKLITGPRLDFTQILPSDLVNLVTKHLDFDNLIRFSLVSRPWSTHSSLPPMTAPLLIVPFNNSTSKVDYSYDSATLGLFSLSNGNVYKLERPEIENRRICGSCLGGWIITVNEDGEIQALRLLSKTVVELPSMWKLPAVVGLLQLLKSVMYITHETEHAYVLMSSRMMCNYYIYKAVMSSADPNTSVVMCIQGLLKGLAFCRLGKDETWSSVEGVDNDGLDDITFYQGKFYVVGKSGHVFVVEGLDGPSPSLKLIISAHDLPSDDSHTYYLVEVSDELLLVTRTRSDDPLVGSDLMKKEPDSSVSYKTTNFKVSKLDFDGPKWIEGYNLEKDCALFVGFNQSFSLTTTDFPGCKGNSIYFTDDFVERNSQEQFGGHDIGIFDLAYGNTEKCYRSNAMGIKPSPIWFSTCSC